MAAMVATLGVSHGAWAEEGEAPAPQAVKTEFTWVASEAGKPVGVERMKGVKLQPPHGFARAWLLAFSPAAPATARAQT